MFLGLSALLTGEKVGHQCETLDGHIDGEWGGGWGGVIGWQNVPEAVGLDDWRKDRVSVGNSRWLYLSRYGPLARYVTLLVAHAPRMPGTFSPPPWVNDPDMHHGMCVTHEPWCMSGSLTSGFLWSRSRGSEKIPGIPSACAPRSFTFLVRGSWRGVLIVGKMFLGRHCSMGKT